MSIVYPFGRVTVSIPAAGSLAISVPDKAVISRQFTFVNQPTSIQVIGEVNATVATFGPYAAGATLIIDNFAGEAEYSVGAAPAVDVGERRVPDPVAVNTTGAVSAAAILGGIVTSTTGAAVGGTLPTGTVLDAATTLAVNDAVEWSVINTGGNAFTILAASGHTIVGGAVVATVTSGRFLTRKTAANTFVTYRLA